MARPTKTEDKRTERLELRLSPDEKKRIEEAAKEAGYTPSDFIRVKVIDSKPRTKIATPDRAILLKGLAELGKIGSNINQIARHYNRKADTEGETLPPQLLAYSLQGVETLTRHLITQLENPNGD